MTQERKEPEKRRNVFQLLKRRINSIVSANQRAIGQSRQRFTKASQTLRRRQFYSTPNSPLPPLESLPDEVMAGFEPGSISTTLPAQPALAEEAYVLTKSNRTDFTLLAEKGPYISFLTALPDDGQMDEVEYSTSAADGEGPLFETVPAPTFDPNRRSSTRLLLNSTSPQPTSERRKFFKFRQRPRSLMVGLFTVLALFILVLSLLYLSRFLEVASSQKFMVVYGKLGEANGSTIQASDEGAKFTKELSDNYKAQSGISASEARVTEGILKDTESINSEALRNEADVVISGYYDQNSKLLNLNLTLRPNGPFDQPDGLGYKEIKCRLFDPDALNFVSSASADPNAKRPLTVLLSGLYNYYNGGYEQAVADFLTLIRTNDRSNLPALYLLRGNALFAFGKYSEALDEYNKLQALIKEAEAAKQSLPLDPMVVLNNRAIVISYLPNGYDEAMRSLEEALRQNGDRQRLRVNYIALQMDRPGASFTPQQLNDNLKLLESSLAKPDESSPSAYYYMGRIYTLQNNLEKAIESYKKAEEQASEQAGTYRELGWVYLQSGRDDQLDLAQRQFQQGLDLAQRQIQQSRDIAARFVTQNDTTLGRVWQSRAQNLENVQNDLKYGLARIYFEKGFREGNQVGNPFDKAIRWAQGKKTALEETRDRLTEVINAQPNSGDPYLYLGQTFELLGEGDANAQYAKAKQLEKDNPAKLLNFAESLATFFKKQARVNEAVAQYSEYLRRFPNSFQGHLQFAKLYLELGQFDKALTEAQTAIKNTTGIDTQITAEALVVAGRAQLSLNRSTEALAYFEQALQRRSDYIEAHYQRGNALFALKRFNDARSEYTTVIASNSNAFPEAHYRLGLIYLQQLNDPQKAREEFELAVKQQPNLVAAYLQLGQLYSRNNATLEESLAAYTEVIKYDGRNFAAYYLRGLLLEGKNNLVAAEADYRKALEIEPGLVNARQHFALILLKSGKLGEALKEAQAAANQDKSSADLQTTLGDIYRLSGDYDRAATTYTEAIRLRSNSPDALYGRALAYYKRTNYDVGMVDVNQLVKQNPTYPGALVLQGQYLAQKGQIDQALKALEQARQLNDKDPDLYTSFGLVYLRQNQADLALAAFNQAVQLNPNQVEAHFWLGSLYNGRSERDKAIAEYEKTVQLQPEWALAWRYLGEQYVAKGNFDAAIQKFDVAIQKDDHQIEAFFQRGNAYRAKGQRAKAQESYDGALALNAKYAPALLQKAITYEEVGDTAGARDYYKRAIQNAQPSEGEIKADAQRSLTRIGA
ncbi:MAG: tetratricopeptide repeat protein [Chloroflexi bacterium]|nr:tetratricopeptide repeat protein [Chloroflexota bacterium]